MDFAIVDDEYRIVALVELDDSTHDADRDAERDRMTGMPICLTSRNRQTGIKQKHPLLGPGC